MSRVNEISVLRKRVVTNIPGFSDDETGRPQNEWFKLYDFTCVDTAPGQTARVYNLEDSPENDNNDNTYYIEFNFDSTRQYYDPPYDINEGDYVAFYQGGEHHFIRIVKIIVSQMFPSCCVFQLVTNVTNPRAIERLQGCGVMSIIPDEELEGEEESE